MADWEDFELPVSEIARVVNIKRTAAKNLAARYQWPYRKVKVPGERSKRIYRLGDIKTPRRVRQALQAHFTQKLIEVEKARQAQGANDSNVSRKATCRAISTSNLKASSYSGLTASSLSSDTPLTYRSDSNLALAPPAVSDVDAGQRSQIITSGQRGIGIQQSIVRQRDVPQGIETHLGMKIGQGIEIAQGVDVHHSVDGQQETKIHQEIQINSINELRLQFGAEAEATALERYRAIMEFEEIRNDPLYEGWMADDIAGRYGISNTSLYRYREAYWSAFYATSPGRPGHSSLSPDAQGPGRVNMLRNGRGADLVNVRGNALEVGSSEALCDARRDGQHINNRPGDGNQTPAKSQNGNQTPAKGQGNGNQALAKSQDGEKLVSGGRPGDQWPLAERDRRHLAGLLAIMPKKKNSGRVYNPSNDKRCKTNNYIRDRIVGILLLAEHRGQKVTAANIWKFMINSCIVCREGRMVPSRIGLKDGHFVEHTCPVCGFSLSYRTVNRIVNNVDPRARSYAMGGRQLLLKQFGCYIRRNNNILRIGEFIVGDHHQFNNMVYDNQGRLFRPWITGYQDLRTRAIVGYFISPNPNSQTICLAFRDMMINPVPGIEDAPPLGRCENVYHDNGKDYRARRLVGRTVRAGKGSRRAVTKEYEEVEEGIRIPDPPQEFASFALSHGIREIPGEFYDELSGLFQAYGIETTWAIPYNARTKMIERFFGTICRNFSGLVPGWCGANTSERPEILKEKVRQHQRWLKGDAKETPFLHFEYFKMIHRAWLAEYHNTYHHGLEARPANVYRQLIAERDPRYAQPIDPGGLAILLMKKNIKKVMGDGVSLFNKLYYFNGLERYEGLKALACYDPEDLSRVYLFIKKRFVGIAVNEEFASMRMTEEQLKKIIKKKRQIDKARLESVKGYIECKMEALGPVDGMCDISADKNKTVSLLGCEFNFEDKSLGNAEDRGIDINNAGGNGNGAGSGDGLDNGLLIPSPINVQVVGSNKSGGADRYNDDCHDDYQQLRDWGIDVEQYKQNWNNA